MSTAAYATPHSDKIARNKAAATLFFTTVFNDGNYEILKRGIQSGYSYGGKSQSAADVQAWVEGLRTSYPDLHFSLQTIIGEGNEVALRWHMQGTASGGPYVGQLVQATGTNILTYSEEGVCLSNMQNGVCTLPGQTVTDDLIYAGLYFKTT
jgi:hypothetical protein